MNRINGYKTRRLLLVVTILLAFAIIGAAVFCGLSNLIVVNESAKEVKIENNIAKKRCGSTIINVSEKLERNDYKKRIRINQDRKIVGGVPLVVVMYHNIVPNNCRETDYEVTVSSLENDLRYLKDNGYTTLNSVMLSKVISGEISGGKYAMLTFDDGFHSYLKYLPPLLEKYDMQAVASVVGQFSSTAKVSEIRPRCSYLTYEEVSLLRDCGRVEIACHTNNLHSMKDRKGVRIVDGESKKQYKEMLVNDCYEAEKKLNRIGIVSQCYTYPYGEYCDESEMIVRERGYIMTLTCYEHRNYITKDIECMYLLGRFNRKGAYESLDEIMKFK